MQAILGLQTFTQYLNIIRELLSKFHNFWSPFKPPLPFIRFKHACKLTRVKPSFHISPSYPSFRSTRKESISTEFAFLGFFFDLLCIFTYCLKLLCLINSDFNLLCLITFLEYPHIKSFSYQIIFLSLPSKLK